MAASKEDHNGKRWVMMKIGVLTGGGFVNINP
jgi:hypothetical protein